MCRAHALPVADGTWLLILHSCPLALGTRLINLQRQSATGTAMCFLKRDRQFSLDVPAAHPKIAARAKSPPPSPEERLEEVAESRGTGSEDVASIDRSFLPLGWSTELGAGLPIRPQLVVTLPLLGIGQDFIGLLDLFEFGLRVLVSRIQIRMVLPGQASMGFANCLRRRGARDFQDRVIVLVCHRHDHQSEFRR